MRSAITIHATCCIAILFLIIFPGFIEAAEVSSELLTLQKAADQAVQKKQFDIAGKTYESIIRSNPTADAAIDARGKLISVYLQAGQRARADAAAEALMTQASNSAAFKQALTEAGQAYRWKANDSARARQLYSRWMEKYGADLGMQTAVVKTWLEEKNFEQANAALETFKQVCKDQERVFYETNHLAGEFKKIGHPEKAVELCQWFLSTYPNHEKTVSAKVTLNASLIDLHLQKEEWPQANAALKELLAQEAEPEVQPEIAKTVRLMGDVYRRKGHNAEAIPLYKTSIDRCPKAGDVIYAHRGLACALIEAGDVDNAKKSAESILSDYASHPDGARLIREIAERCYQQGHYKDAGQLYATCSESWATVENTILSQRGVACALIRQGDPDSAKPIAEKLFSEYAKRPEIARAIREIADAYRFGKYIEESLPLYRTCIDRWPNDEDSIHFWRGLGCSLAQQGDIAGAAQAAKKILTDYANHPKAGTMVFHIGEEYYMQAYDLKKNAMPLQSAEAFRKAIDTWTVLREGSPDSVHTPMAWYYSAVAYRDMGENETAINYYGYVVEHWPGYNMAWNAQFQIALLIQESCESGKYDVQSVRDAYLRLIEKYPDCQAAADARQWLANNTVSREIENGDL